MLRLYTRVLELLGKEARLGWILAAANLLLAGAQFAEPVLFGRIIDVLSGKPASGPLASSSAWPLLAAWVAFGLFTILCSAAVALNADKLAHRQRQAVLTDYFEHIMAGYWNRPEETANVMTSDGYFRTGDIGVMDERGYTKIVDRKKDMSYLGRPESPSPAGGERPFV